jgi:hypothetical protein
MTPLRQHGLGAAHAGGVCRWFSLLGLAVGVAASLTPMRPAVGETGLATVGVSATILSACRVRSVDAPRMDKLGATMKWTSAPAAGVSSVCSEGSAGVVAPYSGPEPAAAAGTAPTNAPFFGAGLIDLRSWVASRSQIREDSGVMRYVVDY